MKGLICALPSGFAGTRYGAASRYSDQFSWAYRGLGGWSVRGSWAKLTEAKARKAARTIVEWNILDIIVLFSLLDVQVYIEKQKWARLLIGRFLFFPMLVRYGAHCYLQVGVRLSFSLSRARVGPFEIVANRSL